MDVINTTLQLILPCLDKVKILATIGDKRTGLTPKIPTVGELVPTLNVSLWNGLFVKKGTPADVREKIIAVAKKTMASDRAKKLAVQTGALIYWQDAASAKAQITKDIKTLDGINKMLAN